MKNSKHDSNLPSFILKGFAMKISYCAGTTGTKSSKVPGSSPALDCLTLGAWCPKAWVPYKAAQLCWAVCLRLSQCLSNRGCSHFLTSVFESFFSLQWPSLSSSLPSYSSYFSLFPQFSFCLALLYVPLPRFEVVQPRALVCKATPTKLEPFFSFCSKPTNHTGQG